MVEWDRGGNGASMCRLCCNISKGMVIIGEGKGKIHSYRVGDDTGNDRVVKWAA